MKNGCQENKSSRDEIHADKTRNEDIRQRQLERIQFSGSQQYNLIPRNTPSIKNVKFMQLIFMI